jgi:hypothetical protein
MRFIRVLFQMAGLINFIYLLSLICAKIATTMLAALIQKPNMRFHRFIRCTSFQCLPPLSAATDLETSAIVSFLRRAA